MTDRIIHAITVAGTRIVHDNGHRKWYAEYTVGERDRLSLAEAVHMAVRRGSLVYLGKPGGKTFDARLKATILERVS